MSIITFTTDLGRKDHYVANLKGTVLRHHPRALMIDVTHEVSPFNVMEAAFLLESAFRQFPEGTIHIIAVDPDTSREHQGIAMEFEGHYFVGPDNGVMSLIKKKASAEVVAISNAKIIDPGATRSFISQGVYAPAAAFLANGGKMEELGETWHMKEALWGEPTYTHNSLRGVILHIDRFGNAITNITKDEFLRLKGDRSFQIFIRNVRLQRIVSAYSDVSRGEALALFSANNHLEISIREGAAAQLLGLKIQDMLTIEFYG